ncbi:MAG: hypothetical protein HC886_11870 [Leptolyngbyaceae cyanobacterium SM1_1_3]|nr:hypothetical protein [Leptolyngbyaceae cyanobacterium SM1_1_3]NJN01829.1 hypothetical protein [Leptolyngbyaceae cyanobacterium RM1_1_2]NJO10642.1 hypothetical protein [Leptolyngbyaceae cyanobacterium SL_1_1]
MNSDSFTELLQKGFRIALGATASLVEAVQDPARQSERFSEINGDWNRLSEDLESKGTVAEQEARQMVDSMMAQIPGPFSQSRPTHTPVSTVNMPTVEVSLQTEIKILTQELEAIRRDIIQLNQSDS